MQAPDFWYREPGKPGILAQILRPLGWLYGKATANRQKNMVGKEAGIPVICVGNLNVGGTGKTPTIIALLEKLGSGTHVLSRGYGGAEKGPLRVDERKHTAAIVGDEPLLVSAFGPTFVSDNRAAGLSMACKDAKFLLLDDGFQDPSIRKNISIIVVDARQGFGNGLCLPAGPLREPVNAGLARADLILTIGTPEDQARFDRIWAKDLNLPRLRGALRPLQTGMDFAGMEVFAFAGIGQPEKFFATLRGLGANVRHAEALNDHQPLTDALMSRLAKHAASLNAQLVTTEKDAIRLPPHWRSEVLTVPVRLEVEDWRPLDQLISAI